MELQYGILFTTSTVSREINSSSDKAILQGTRWHLFSYPEHEHVSFGDKSHFLQPYLARMLDFNQCDSVNTQVVIFFSHFA